MFGFGYGELLLLVLVVFLLFGNRLPGTMKSLGLGIREFKQAVRGDAAESNSLESQNQIEVN